MPVFVPAVQPFGCGQAGEAAEFAFDAVVCDALAATRCVCAMLGAADIDAAFVSHENGDAAVDRTGLEPRH